MSTTAPKKPMHRVASLGGTAQADDDRALSRRCPLAANVVRKARRRGREVGPASAGGLAVTIPAAVRSDTGGCIVTIFTVR